MYPSRAKQPANNTFKIPYNIIKGRAPSPPPAPKDCGNFRKALVVCVLIQVLVVVLVVHGVLQLVSQVQPAVQQHITKSLRDIAFSPPTDSLGSQVVDIHLEDELLGHTWKDDDHVNHEITPVIHMTDIAIGMGITSRKLLTELSKWPFFKTLMPSFCKTASEAFRYNFFLAYDFNDKYFSKIDRLEKFVKKFQSITLEHCPENSEYSIHFVQCTHKGNPAQAQNDAMMAAYMLNMAFYYRINDDTIMKSPGWTTTFIQTLQNYDPEYIGVVGPNHKNGNEGILTYDFVHISHINVFGFYYPHVFTDWYGDSWISSVYKPGRVTKVQHIHLVHTLAIGQRYVVRSAPRKMLKPLIKQGQSLVKQYVRSVLKNQAQKLTPDPKKVISMTLYGENPDVTYGAIRNAQLMPVFFPEWTLRIYIADTHTKSTSSSAVNRTHLLSGSNASVSAAHQPHANYTIGGQNLNVLNNTHGNLTLQPNPKYSVPSLVINKLVTLGAKIMYVDGATAQVLYPNLWRYLVLDDQAVSHFLIRDARSRISARDRAVVDYWLDANLSNQTVMCTREHLSQTKTVLPAGGYIGAKASDLRDRLKTSVMEYAQETFHQTHKMATETSFLDDTVYPRTKDVSVCFDSVTCDKFENSQPFPVFVSYRDFLGQTYNRHEEPQGVNLPNNGCIASDARKL